MSDKIKILVVDDESRMRKLVRDFLEREGYQVLEAGNGLEAMELFYEEKDIALLILDVMIRIHKRHNNIADRQHDNRCQASTEIHFSENANAHCD